MSRNKAIKIKNKPKNWPYVSTSQQIDGLKFVVRQVNIVVFKRALYVLVGKKYINKSGMYKLAKRYRKIANISYEQWSKQ